MWTLTEDAKPVESGYYFVEYYNSQREDWFYKSLWYNADDDKWQGPWNWSYDRIYTVLEDGREFYRIVHKGLEVKRYVKDTLDNYYVPSMMKYEELIKECDSPLYP